MSVYGALDRLRPTRRQRGICGAVVGRGRHVSTAEAADEAEQAAEHVRVSSSSTQRIRVT